MQGVFPVSLDNLGCTVTRVVLACWVREENLEPWGQRVHLAHLVEWVLKVLWVLRACKEREAGWDQQDLWENVVPPVMLVNQAHWVLWELLACLVSPATLE